MTVAHRRTRLAIVLAVAVALLGGAAVLTAVAQEGAVSAEERVASTPEEVNAKAARLFVDDVYNDRNLDAIPLYVDPEFVDRSPGAPPEAQGPDFVRHQAEYTLAAFPDLRFEILRTVAEGDKVAIHWKMTGTASGQVGGPGAEGKAVEMQGISMFRYADGFVVESWDLVDRLAMLQQLGFTVTPPAPPKVDLEEPNRSSPSSP